MRIPDAIKYRKKNYILSLLCTLVLFVMSIIGCIFYWEVIVLLLISAIVFIAVIFEWLKIKNNHLIIKNNQIEITNRFNKIKIYKINILMRFMALSMEEVEISLVKYSPVNLQSEYQFVLRNRAGVVPVLFLNKFIKLLISLIPTASPT